MEKEDNKQGHYATEVFTLAVRRDGTAEIKFPRNEGGKEYDGYGRDVTGWITVAGKRRPHP